MTNIVSDTLSVASVATSKSLTRLENTQSMILGLMEDHAGELKDGQYEQLDRIRLELNTVLQNLVTVRGSIDTACYEQSRK